MSKQAGNLDLNWTKTTGSALAALSSAVLLSTLGATGTLIGAAVGSIVVTVGGTVYSHYLSVSRARMAAAREAALSRASRTGRSRSGATATAGSVEAVTRAVAEAPERFPLLAASARGAVAAPTTGSVVPPATAPGTSGPRLIDGYLPGTPTSFRQILHGLRWKPALAASLGVFVLVMGVIVSMELATGRALSSYTGGSSADGPRTSIALLSSTSDAGGSESTTTDQTDKGNDQGSGGSSDATGSGAGSQGAGDTGRGANNGTDAGTTADTDETQSDTSTTEPDAGTPTEPAPEPTPDTPTEPAPQPTPAPSTQAPAKAPVRAPAPATGAAISGAAADDVS